MMFKAKILLIGITLTLVITLLLALLYVQEIENERYLKFTEQPEKLLKNKKLAILVPFRDRFDELLEFVPHIHSFLTSQSISHEIFVLNQVDQFRFNRGSLINAGFKEIISSDSLVDYIAMHDVDLLPLNSLLDYHYPPKGHVSHIAAPHLHPRYHYSSFVGGILLITKKHFIEINGLSNNYWGWGLEDDEFYLRLKEAKIRIHRPGNLTTGVLNTFKHNHDRAVRKRDMTKCYNQREVTRKRDRLTGLHNVIYYIKNKHNLLIDSIPTKIINIELKCNKTTTPWCLCFEYNVKNIKKKKN
ncbi:beta-1,4-galactosyltransferase 7 [Daktulosphaira vitifoliae]|uniref:beta-1,4-galactosyltransferase 7 n=1 Tax=Daktulosphaira vitifoliae TaxID=58002 RepID=UPI0021A9A071|nr:beta-1,4-galactosyltransferase 7 [Daktulosphaira vitifoliae]